MKAHYSQQREKEAMWVEGVPPERSTWVQWQRRTQQRMRHRRENGLQKGVKAERSGCAGRNKPTPPRSVAASLESGVVSVM